MRGMTQNTLSDFHFLYVATNLGGEWFFDAARLYWETFRPIVISDFVFVTLVPSTRTVSVTALARRDTVVSLGVELARLRPDALFDPVAYDLFEDMKAALEERAALNQPFGAPLVPTRDPRIDPTPGSLLGETREPGGFITQTPTNTPTMQPTQPPAGTPSAPIDPTPGSVIGG